MSDAWRLLLDRPAAGAWNMAVDEVLLDGVAAGATPPTLRFYQWEPSCLSLGYFQSLDVVNLDGCHALGVDVVRRPTGGRAILHDRELTYSIALPDAVLGRDGVLDSYRRLSLALQDGLHRLGVPATMAPESAAGVAASGPVCFDRPSAYEILFRGRKLVGSAQVRRMGGVLQHGSIVIEPAAAKMLACLRMAEGSERIPSGMVGLEEAGVSDPAQIAGAMADAFAARFGVSLIVGDLRPDERAAVQALAGSKYRAAGWMEAVAATKTTRTR
jgi:lipoyl(octanoyl) transferase